MIGRQQTEARLLGWRIEKCSGRGWLIVKDGKRIDMALNKRNAQNRVKKFIADPAKFDRLLP